MGKIIYAIVAKIPDPQGLRGDKLRIPLDITFEAEEEAYTWIKEVGPRSIFSEFEVRPQVFHPKGEKVSA